MALSINKAWDGARAVLASDGKLLATVAAAMVFLPTVLDSLVDPQAPGMTEEAASAPSTGIILLGLGLLIITLAGQLALVAAIMKRGRTVGQAIATGFAKVLPLIGAFCIVFLPLFLILGIAMVAILGVNDLEQMQAALQSSASAGLFLLVLLVWIVAVIFVAVRFLLTSAVVVAETSNPVRILQRSWELTRGHFWKLLGFVILFGLVTVVALSAVGLMAGLLAVTLLGPIEPMSVSALMLGVLAGLFQSGVAIIYIAILVQIYRQLVPDDSNLGEVFA